MRHAVLLFLGLVSFAPVLSFPCSHGEKGDHLGILDGGEDPKEWTLDELPSPNATDHLVFDTVNSLLQRWSNTRMRNGHNIVPGVIPEGTLLYHGTYRNVIPENPDWVTPDPEFSHLFCGEPGEVKPNHQQDGCWHLTLASTRPLKVLYFDGSSAAKIPNGTLDTQDLLLWGAPSSGDLSEEVPRIQDFCKWGRRFGLDGFDGNDFIMICDFTSGLTVVSFLNIVRPDGTVSTRSPLAMFEPVNAGSWHNHFPGETRVQLDLSGLVSFYDTQLVPSLVPIRARQERWDHRVAGTSDEDIRAVKSRLEATLTRLADPSRAIDWKTHLQVIVDRFAERLELARYLSTLPADSDGIVDLVNKTQTQFRVMLTPYLHLSAVPPDPSDKTALEWTIPIYKHCATSHTFFAETLLGSMTESERLILRALRQTNKEICRVVTKMWADGVYAGVDAKLNRKGSGSLDVVEMTRLRDSWARDLNRLMTWLDWSVWVKCDPACGPTEICYLPSWPVGFPNSPNNQIPSLFELDTPQERLSNFDSLSPDRDAWIRPQPKCIRRVAPYDF